MSNSGKRKPLTAEKRYQKPQKTKRKPSAKRKPAPKRGRKRARNPIFRFFGWLWRLIWGTVWRATVVGVLILAVTVGYVYTTIPELSELVDQRARGSVTMLDRYGQVYAWRGEQFGGMITTETVSPHLRNAVVATEDKRFYRHFGISPRGIASAVRINLSEGRGPLSGHGGSTITQQTAKLLCLGEPYDPEQWLSEAAYEQDCRETSLWRKAREAIYAMALEAKFTKDEVLTIYLNRAFLGEGARGFEAGAQRYFGISANELGPSEAAMLAGMLVAPTRYRPTGNLQRSRDRAATVLRLMEEQGYLTATEASFAQDHPAELSGAAQQESGGYFADWIMRSGPDFLTRDTTEDVIIRTTLDPEIQRAAEDAVDYIFSERVSEGSGAQAAVVVMSADGAVRAMVGGRDTPLPGGFNRAVQAMRQTGSTFKPFVYAAALDLGWSPNDYIHAGPICLDVPGSRDYCPDNYGGATYGMIPLTQALANSVNTAAVRLADEVGLDIVRTVAEQFGIESDLADGPALALGASESSLLEMTGAYAGILNGGSSVTPYGLTELRLQGDSSPLMEQTSGIGERVITPRAAGELTYMMSRVVQEGSGGRARLPGREVAGKTGTTQSARDAWFIGFTADYVAGVWMGYDDNSPLTGVTGGGLPAETWHETMRRVHDGTPAKPLPMIIPEPPAPTPPQQEQPGGGNRGLFDLLFGGGN